LPKYATKQFQTLNSVTQEFVKLGMHLLMTNSKTDSDKIE